VIREHLRRCRALLFPGEEDFGIVPVEAQACGTPVIAFGRGGALESVVGLPLERPTGVFFGEQTTESLLEAVGRFEANASLFDPRQCRKNAERFSTENFKKALMSFVDARLPYAGVEQYLPYVSNAPLTLEERRLVDVTP
jgi:glycosyltransferase involved in cell wall biosynthesis